MISFVNGYRAVLDTCVLAPMPVCAVLLKLAQEPAMYSPYWSEKILQELVRALAKPSFSLSASQIERRLKYMNSSFEEASISGFEDLIPVMPCHEDDRHVLAVAVYCKAHAIITNNTKHFPKDSLAKYSIEPLTADEFLVHQQSLSPSLIIEKLDELAAIRNWEAGPFLDRLSITAPEFVKAVKNHH